MSKCRILIVEDELISRQAFKYILGMDTENFEIVGEAYNGRDGLELVDKLHPHIIISDVVMPVMNGIDFARAAQLHLPGVHTIMLSGHSDFEYVKAAFQSGAADYILKSQVEPDMLLDKLYDIMNKLGMEPVRSHDSLSANHWLTAAVRGEQFVPPEGLPPCHTLLACSLHRLRRAGLGGQQNAVELMNQQAADMLGDFVLCDVINNDEWLMLVSYNEHQRAHVAAACYELATVVSGSASVFFFVLGRQFCNLHELYERYSKLSVFAELGFYFAGHSLVLEEKLSTPDLHPAFDMKGYTEKLKLHAHDLAYADLVTFVNTLGQHGYLREGELKKLLDSAIYSAVDALMEETSNRDRLYTRRMEFFSAIDRSGSIEELREAVRSITMQLQGLGERTIEPMDELRQRIAAYVSANFAEQITLNSVANHLHLNYSYLSSCFGRCLGCGFSEYLNNVRLDAASELLSSTNTPVAEISGMVGYSEQGYFGKVFKKKTGLSPMEYRKRTSGR